MARQPWVIAYLGDENQPEGFVSIGRHDDPQRARGDVELVRQLTVLAGRPHRAAVVMAESADEAIGKAPLMVPPGACIQSMDVENAQELDVLTDKPTGRDLSEFKGKLFRGAEERRRRAQRRRRRRKR